MSSNASRNPVGLTKTLKSKDFFSSIPIELDTVSKLNSESAGSKNPKTSESSSKNVILTQTA